MTKINLLKKREDGLLTGLLGSNLQIATVCIPAYAILGRSFWLATLPSLSRGAFFAAFGAPGTSTCTPAKIRLRCIFRDRGIYMCTNSLCINTPTYCVWY